MTGQAFEAARHDDSWYDLHPQAFASERAALRALLHPVCSQIAHSAGSPAVAHTDGLGL